MLTQPGCCYGGSGLSQAPGDSLQVSVCVCLSKPQKDWAPPGSWSLTLVSVSPIAGFLPRIIKAAPSCAIMISTYEFGKSFFQRLNREQTLGS